MEVDERMVDVPEQYSTTLIVRYGVDISRMVSSHKVIIYGRGSLFSCRLWLNDTGIAFETICR